MYLYYYTSVSTKFILNEIFDQPSPKLESVKWYLE